MIFAVGDIHGQLRQLTNLIARLPLQGDDLIVFIGDYIDRGPDSKGVVQFLIDLNSQRGNCVFLRGNHEQMLLDARKAFLRKSVHAGDLYALWAGNGGAEAIDSYPKARPWFERIPEDHWTFFEETQLDFWLKPFAFVHAGFLPPNRSWPYIDDHRLWIREEFLDSTHDFGARVIFGHTPQRSGKPLIHSNKIGIDTAAAFGGPLTAVKLDTENPEAFEFFQV